MKNNNSVRSGIKNLKILGVGVLAGAVMLTGANHYTAYIAEKRQSAEEFEDKFGAIELPDSVSATEKVKEKKYSIKTDNGSIDIQDENLTVWGFDKNGKRYKVDLEEVEVEKEKKNYINNNYVTEEEYNIFNRVSNKDDIKNQYSIYTLFTDMTKLCESYLSREDFEGKDDRIDYIYGVCISYIKPDSNYTFGGYKYSELDRAIQNDIEKEVIKIKYIKDNKCIKEESFGEKFEDNLSKLFNYGILDRGK